MKPFTILAIIFSLVSIGCKDKRGPWIIDPTNIILIQPKIENNGISDLALEELKLYIIDDGKKIYDPGDFYKSQGKSFDLDDSVYLFKASNKYDSKLKDQGILLVIASYLEFDNSLGPKHGIGTCYLEFPDGSIDTIKIEGERVSDEEGAKDRCHCSFPIRNVWVNGKLCNVSEEYSTQHGVYYYEH